MTARRLNITRRALRDLDNIHDWIADASDSAAAREFLVKLNVHLEAITSSGHGGVSRDIIRSGLRLTVHGRYNIYFRVVETETIIVRVLHASRDTCRLVFDEQDPPA